MQVFDPIRAINPLAKLSLAKAPSRLNAFEISDIQEEKLTPGQPGDQDATMLHHPERRSTEVLRSTGQP
jgi:hypothetical protein